MRRKPTTAILVIAILHLVGGGLDLLGTICGCGSLILTSSLASAMPAPPTLPARPGQPPPPMPPNTFEIMKQMNDTVPGYRAFTIGSLAVTFLFGILLLSSGIGLLKMQTWARWLSLVYASISILFHIGAFVYQLIWVLPATKAAFANMPMPAGFSSIMTLSSGIGLVVSLLYFIYPIAVIIILLLPSSGAAFRGEIPIADHDDWRDEEEHEEDHWREPPPRSDKFRE